VILLLEAVEGRRFMVNVKICYSFIVCVGWSSHHRYVPTLECTNSSQMLETCHQTSYQPWNRRHYLIISHHSVYIHWLIAADGSSSFPKPADCRIFLNFCANIFFCTGHYEICTYFCVSQSHIDIGLVLFGPAPKLERLTFFEASTSSHS